MNYRGLSADPEGLLIFDSPTDVRVKSGSGITTTTVEIIAYNALIKNDDKPDVSDEIWIGDETYYLPASASYTTVTDLAALASRVETAATDGAGRAGQPTAES